jgi:hypothetical protein
MRIGWPHRPLPISMESVIPPIRPARRDTQVEDPESPLWREVAELSRRHHGGVNLSHVFRNDPTPEEERAAEDRAAARETAREERTDRRLTAFHVGSGNRIETLARNRCRGVLNCRPV